MKSKMKDQILPKYLNRLTKFLNDHGERYFVGSKVKLFITHLVCIFPFATQLTLLTSRAGTDHASACLVRIRITLLSELLGFFPLHHCITFFIQSYFIKSYLCSKPNGNGTNNCKTLFNTIFHLCKLKRIYLTWQNNLILIICCFTRHVINTIIYPHHIPWHDMIWEKVCITCNSIYHIKCIG